MLQLDLIISSPKSSDKCIHGFVGFCTTVHYSFATYILLQTRNLEGGVLILEVHKLATAHRLNDLVVDGSLEACSLLRNTAGLRGGRVRASGHLLTGLDESARIRLHNLMSSQPPSI